MPEADRTQLPGAEGGQSDRRQGEKFVVCGPSGSGKSTMIRCINGLEGHDSGHITVNGTLLADERSAIAVRREVGMVFESLNLFPHLTVVKNSPPPATANCMNGRWKSLHR